ncbi:hypothetical protein R6Z07F_018982 [Ovis aries]
MVRNEGQTTQKQPKARDTTLSPMESRRICLPGLCWTPWWKLQALESGSWKAQAGDKHCSVTSTASSVTSSEKPTHPYRGSKSHLSPPFPSFGVVCVHRAPHLEYELKGGQTEVPMMLCQLPRQRGLLQVEPRWPFCWLQRQPHLLSQRINLRTALNLCLM